MFNNNVGCRDEQENDGRFNYILNNIVLNKCSLGTCVTIIEPIYDN